MAREVTQPLPPSRQTHLGVIELTEGADILQDSRRVQAGALHLRDNKQQHQVLPLNQREQCQLSGHFHQVLVLSGPALLPETKEQVPSLQSLPRHNHIRLIVRLAIGGEHLYESGVYVHEQQRVYCQRLPASGVEQRSLHYYPTGRLVQGLLRVLGGVLRACALVQEPGSGADQVQK